MSAKPQKLRRHCLPEWMEERGVSAPKLVELLNENATEGEGLIDKSQVYRWMKGQLPHAPTQERIARVLNIVNPITGKVDPKLLQSHPSQAWIYAKVSNRSDDELRRMREVLDAAFPDDRT